MKEVRWCYSPWGHSCDVVCSWEQKAIVVPILPGGQVVANACHHNADVGECSTTDGLFHISTNTFMYLEDRVIVNTKDV